MRKKYELLSKGWKDQEAIKEEKSEENQDESAKFILKLQQRVREFQRKVTWALKNIRSKYELLSR